MFSRPKFDPYASLSARLHFLEEFTNRSLKVAIAETVTICRDPKDNKFLELALNGQADLILTGDDHLLSLHPWRGIPIHNSQGYLALSL